MANIFEDLEHLVDLQVGPKYGVYNVFAEAKTGKSFLAVLLWERLVKAGYKIIVLDCDKGRDGFASYKQDPYNMDPGVILRITDYGDVAKFMNYVKKAPIGQFEKTLLFVDPFSQVAHMKLLDLISKVGTDDMMAKLKTFGLKSEQETTVLREYKTFVEKSINTLRNVFEFVVLTSHYNYDKIGSMESNVVRQQLDYIGQARNVVTQKSDANIMLTKDIKGYYVNKIPISQKSILTVEFGSTFNPKLQEVDSVYELADHIVEIMKDNYETYYKDYYKQFNNTQNGEVK